MSEPYREPPPLEGDDDIVTVAAHSTAVEAEMAGEYLKDHGITAFVHESASFNPLVNVAAGGVRVLVRDRDAARARSLLAQVAKTATTDEDDDGDGDVRCPRCELSYCFHETTLNNQNTQAMQSSAIVAIALLPFTLFAQKRWRCHKCLYVWEDASEGPARMTPLDPDDPRPVFRLRRRRTGTGLAFGIVLMIFGWLTVMEAVRLPFAVILIFLLLPVAGYAIGRRIVGDVCSAPDCRAVLSRGAAACSACGGAIAGVIGGAHEHFAEAARFRRELAEIKAEDRRGARARKRKGKKSPARAARGPANAG